MSCVNTDIFDHRVRRKHNKPNARTNCAGFVFEARKSRELILSITASVKLLITLACRLVTLWLAVYLVCLPIVTMHYR
jgi:hypothetical protein